MNLRVGTAIIFIVFVCVVMGLGWALRPVSDTARYIDNSLQLVRVGERLQILDDQILALDKQVDAEEAEIGMETADKQVQAAKLVAAQLATAWHLQNVSSFNVADLYFTSQADEPGQALNAFHANLMVQALMKQQLDFGAKLDLTLRLEKEPAQKKGDRAKAVALKKNLEKKRESALLKLKDRQIQKAELLPGLKRNSAKKETSKVAANEVKPSALKGRLNATSSAQVDADLRNVFAIQDNLSDLNLRADELAANFSGRFISRFPTELESIKQPAVGKRYTNNDKVLVVRTADNATVVAPFDAIVKFAGEFRSFGPTIILEHQPSSEHETIHSILYGLTFMTIDPGVPVVKGEPLGQMGRSSDQEKRLYFELQFDGMKVDPLLWLE